MKKIAIYSLLFATSIFAQNTGTASIGIGIGVQNDIYKGVNSKVWPLPVIDYKNDYMYINGAEIGGFLYQNDFFSISLGGRARIEGYYDAKGYMRGMKDRQITLEGGLQANLKTTIGDFKVNGYHDVLDKHGGYSAEIEYNYIFNFNQFGISPFVSIEYLSDGFVEYYYGVKKSEATVSRPYYSGGSTVNFGTGINAYYMINESWSIIGGAKFVFLGDEISDSPIVKKDYRIRTGVGINYRF